MLRWLQAALATALWGFLILGSIGLIEAISQWLRFDLLTGQGTAQGPIRLLMPALVFYGWFGLIVSLLLFLPAGLLVRRQARGRLTALALALAGALATLAMIYGGYLLRTHLLARWWQDFGAIPGGVILAVIWLAVLGVAFWPLRRFAHWAIEQRGRTLVYPVLVVLVSTSLWPDWRQEGEQARTEHLVRVAGPAAERPGAHHVVLITIDAWRLDHLSLLNPQSPPTPNLDCLASEGTLFTRVFATSPWTLPSMATVMTGQPPRALGLSRCSAIPSQTPTLAEMAWAQGYQTAAFVTNAYLTEWFGFDRGFAFFEQSLVLETLLPACRSVLAREAGRYAEEHFEADSAEIVVPKIIAWLWQRRGRGPFFLWTHLLNPHLPYRWRDVPVPDAGDLAVRGTWPRRPDPAGCGLLAGPALDGNGLHAIRDGSFVPDSRQRQTIASLYAREVQFTDHWIGKLIGMLKRSGIYEDAVIVVLADHGEELFDHGGFEHGHSVMPEVTGVPLLIRLPGGTGGGRIIETPLSTMDLLPTVCHLMDWPAPADLPGRSRWAPDDSAMVARADSMPLILENLLYDPEQQGILAWPWLKVSTAGKAEPAWFDLFSDPTASRTVAPPDQSARITSRADTLLAAWDAQARHLTGVSVRSREELPADVQRNLRALGY